MFWNQIAEDSLGSGDYDKAIEYYENLLKEEQSISVSSHESGIFKVLSGNSTQATLVWSFNLTL